MDNMLHVFPCHFHEDRSMTIDDSTLKDVGVAYAITKSITPSADRAILERLGTPELGLIGYYCLVAVNFFILLFFLLLFCHY